MIHCVSITNMSRLVFNHQMIYTAALTSQRRSSRTFLKYTDILLKPYQSVTTFYSNSSKDVEIFVHSSNDLHCSFNLIKDIPQMYKYSTQTAQKCNNTLLLLQQLQICWDLRSIIKCINTAVTSQRNSSKCTNIMFKLLKV